MKKNLVLFIKVIFIIVILFSLPIPNCETVETVSSQYFINEEKKNKSIYIYNTHQGEKYASQSVKEGSQYLMKLLKKKGYEVEYETTDFELYKTKNHIDYAYSYSVSKKYLNAAVRNHGNYDLIIDFHRDSIPKHLSTLTLDGKNYAKLMFVVGKGSQNYQEVNQACNQLSRLINNKIPGLSRGIMLKQSHYNQGVSDHMMLIEVGANENTYEEVTNSLNILAFVIDEYLSK